MSAGSEVGSSIDFCYPEIVPGIPSCYVDVKFGGSVSAGSTGTIGRRQAYRRLLVRVGVTYPVSVSFTIPRPGSFASGDRVSIPDIRGTGLA